MSKSVVLISSVCPQHAADSPVAVAFAAPPGTHRVQVRECNHRQSSRQCVHVVSDRVTVTVLVFIFWGIQFRVEVHCTRDHLKPLLPLPCACRHCPSQLHVLRLAQTAEAHTQRTRSQAITVTLRIDEHACCTAQHIRLRVHLMTEINYSFSSVRSLDAFSSLNRSFCV